MAIAGQDGIAPASTKSESSSDGDEFTNMAAAAVSSGSNGSTTTKAPSATGNGPQRSFSLSQQPAFTSSAKQQQTVLHGHPPHVPAHMQQQFNNTQYQQQQAQQHYTSVTDSATSPASAGPSSGGASYAGPHPHPPPASGSGASPSVAQSSSFPTSTTLHRAASSTSTSGNAGGQANGSYSSNEHPIMPNGSDSLSSVQSPLQPLQANLHPAQYANTSKGTNMQHSQPAYLLRGSSPLSYALQSFPSTSSAPLASTSTALPMSGKNGIQSSMPQQNSSQTPSFDPTFAEKVELFSSVSVSDHRHLFHAYIYDYLYRQGYERTARAFLQDAPNVPTKQGKDGKGKQKANTTAAASSGMQASSSRNKRKRSENEENDTLVADKEEFIEVEQAEISTRPKKRPTSQTSLSNMPDSILEEEDDTEENDDTSSRSMNTTLNQDGKPSTSSSEDSNSTASSSLFFGTSTKDSSSNASLSTQATTATTTSIQTGLESHTATKGSDAGTVTSAGDEHDLDATMNLTNSPLGSRDNLFSPTLFSPNQSPDKSDLILKDNVEREEAEEEDEELPLPDIQIDSNWGFLYEWWEVFWDVWRAKGAKGAGSLAAKAYERTLHDFPQPTVNGVPISSIQPRVGGLPIYTGQQEQLVAQQLHASQSQAPSQDSQHQQASNMLQGPSQTQLDPGVAAPKLQPTVIASRQNSIALTSSVASNVSQLPEENMSAQSPQSSNARVAQPPPLRRMESDSILQMQSTAAAEESRKQQDRNSEPMTFVSPLARTGLQNQPSLRSAPAQLQAQPQPQQQRNAPPPQSRPASVSAQSPAVPPAPQLPNETVQQPRAPEHQLGPAAHLRPASVPYQQRHQEVPLHMQPNQQGQHMHPQAHMQHQQQGQPHFQGQPMQLQPQHPQTAPQPGQAPMQYQQQMMQQPVGPALPGIPRQVSIAVASAPQQLAGPVAGRRLAVSGPPPGYAGAPGQAPHAPVHQMQARPGMPQGAMAGQVQVAIQPGQPVRMVGQPHPGQQHVAIQPSHPGAMVPQTAHMHPHMQHQHVQGQMNPVYVQGSPPGQAVYQGHPAQPGQQRILSQHPQMQSQMVQQHQGMPMYAQQPHGRPMLVQGGPGQPLQQMQAQPQPPQQAGPPPGPQQRTRPPSVAGHQMQMQGTDVDMSSPVPGPMRVPSRSSGSPFLQYANQSANGAPPQFPGRPQPIDLQAHGGHFAHSGQAPQPMPHQGLQVDHEALRRQGMVSPAPGRDSGAMQFHQQQQQQQQARMQEMKRQANGEPIAGQQPGMAQQLSQHPGMQQQSQPMSQHQMQQYKASMHNNHMQQARQMSQVNGQSPHEMTYSPQTAPTPSNHQLQQGMPQPPSSPFPGQQQGPQAAAQQNQPNLYQQQQQQQQAMQQHHHQQQLQQQQHQHQLQQRQQQQQAQQQLEVQQQQMHQQQSQLQPNAPSQPQQVYKSPVPSSMHQQQGVANSPQPHDFAYSGNMQPVQQHQQGMPEEYRNPSQMGQQQQHVQQQMQDPNGNQQQGHDQQGRQMPARQFPQSQAETGPMPPPPAPSGRRGAVAPAMNGQQLPRAPTPASAAATPTANGMLHGSPDPQHQPLTPHTPRTPNAQVSSSGTSAPGSGNSSKAAHAPPPPVAVKNRKRTNTDTSMKTKKPRVSKAKDAKAQEAQVATKNTPQSQATPLPSVEDASLYKAPVQQQNGQQNGMHHQQAPTPQQQAPIPQQQQQMQMQSQHQQQQQQAHNNAMQQSGTIDVPQFSPNLDFSFGDLGDFTQFGIENMSTNLNSNPLLGDDGALNFDDFLVSGWQSTA